MMFSLKTIKRILCDHNYEWISLSLEGSTHIYSNKCKKCGKVRDCHIVDDKWWIPQYAK